MENAPENAPLKILMRVTAVLKGEADSFGKKAVSIRTSIGQQRRHKNTKVRVLPSDWDDINMRVRSSHPQANHLNTVIKKIILEHELSLINGTVQIDDGTFHSYGMQLLSAWSNDLEDSSVTNYTIDFNKIHTYRPTLKMSCMNRQFLIDYKKHLQDKGDAPNTIWRGFRFIRKFMLAAIADGRMKDYPIKGWKDMPKYKNPKTFYLTQDQVDKVEAYSIDDAKPSHLAFIAKWFVLSCYTGLRFGDMYAFNADEHIRGNRLTLYTDKTGEIVSLKITDKLRELFDRVEWKRLHIQNQPANRELKKIQSFLKIRINMTCHVARHTFGVRCADAGIPIETTARLMGHTDIKTTAIYYKITDKRMDEDVKSIF